MDKLRQRFSSACGEPNLAWDSCREFSALKFFSYLRDKPVFLSFAQAGALQYYQISDNAPFLLTTRLLLIAPDHACCSLAHFKLVADLLDLLLLLLQARVDHLHRFLLLRHG